MSIQEDAPVTDTGEAPAPAPAPEPAPEPAPAIAAADLEAIKQKAEKTEAALKALLNHVLQVRIYGVSIPLPDDLIEFAQA